MCSEFKALGISLVIIFYCPKHLLLQFNSIPRLIFLIIFVVVIVLKVGLTIAMFDVLSCVIAFHYVIGIPCGASQIIFDIWTINDAIKEQRNLPIAIVFVGLWKLRVASSDGIFNNISPLAVVSHRRHEWLCKSLPININEFPSIIVLDISYHSKRFKAAAENATAIVRKAFVKACAVALIILIVPYD